MAAPLSKAKLAKLKRGIPDAYRDNGGNLTGTAEALGTTRPTLTHAIEADSGLQSTIAGIDKEIADRIVHTIVGRALNNDLTASIYWTKAQLGWSDRSTVVHKGLNFDPPVKAADDDAEPIKLAVVNGGAPLDTGGGVGEEEPSSSPDSPTSKDEGD